MIYLNVEDLGWQPFITSWLASKKNEVLVANLTKLIERCGLLHPPLTAALQPTQMTSMASVECGMLCVHSS